VVTALLNGDQIFPPMFAVIKAAQKKLHPRSLPRLVGRHRQAVGRRTSWRTTWPASGSWTPWRAGRN